jgi:inositol-polyphosphate multikinase
VVYPLFGCSANQDSQIAEWPRCFTCLTRTTPLNLRAALPYELLLLLLGKNSDIASTELTCIVPSQLHILNHGDAVKFVPNLSQEGGSHAQGVRIEGIRPGCGRTVRVLPEPWIASSIDTGSSEGISSNASGSLIIKPCTAAEISFYESAKDHPLFQAHIPTFIGSLNEHEDQDAVAPLLNAQAAIPQPEAADPTLNDKTWKPSGGKKLSTGTAIVLENITSGFKHPNVLDVKLGARLWDDEAPEAKRQKLDEVASRTTSGKLGYRVAGMKIFGKADGKELSEKSKEFIEEKSGYSSFNKLYGQAFDAENVREAFLTFFGGMEDGEQKGPLAFRHRHAEVLMRRFLREIQSLKYVLENEESRMYSASVLMVYEGDEEMLVKNMAKEERDEEMGEEDEDGDGDDDDDDDDAEVKPHKVHEMRMIDFAHARWTTGQGPDENVLHGLRSLIKTLEDLMPET